MIVSNKNEYAENSKEIDILEINSNLNGSQSGANDVTAQRKDFI